MGKSMDRRKSGRMDGWRHIWTNKLPLYPSLHPEVNKDWLCRFHRSVHSETNREGPALGTYHFCRRAGSEVEFLQVQEEASQLSNQQEKDDSICKLQRQGLKVHSLGDPALAPTAVWPHGGHTAFLSLSSLLRTGTALPTLQHRKRGRPQV